ncbi:MAG TPA: HAMP domain-containing sensor histidine kinase [Anaeromyxobacter sp.]|nr:HAMP domain-containing sensor histidine kinase [Anaeromyxobacter sp.]
MLYEFILTNKNEILSRARAKVTARQWPVVSTEELENGLPLFLTQLAETLRLRSTSEPFSPTAIGTSAGKHGGELLAKGFTVAQVVHDYGDICQAITEAAVEKKVAISSEDFQTLNLCLDNAIAGAVTEFSRQRELALGDGEAERLGYLTHELRNLLSTAMLSFAAVKSGRVAAGGSTGAITERSLMGMRDLLDTTISEVRLSAGTHEAKRMSVARFLDDVEGAASLQAAQREMGLSFAPPTPVDVMIDADPQLLSSALFNLLQNAFKYSIPHGNVAVRAVCENGLVSIEVEDECGGLPEGNSEAFFTPFGARRGKDRSGLGLGLNISRKAVKAFGGEIRVRNLPGKGCIFTIALPAAV